jgi:hypothetical protein
LVWLDIGNAVFTPHIQDRRIADFFLAYGAINTTDALPAVAVRGTLAATDHPKAATADPKMFFDNRFLQELESSGFVKELYGNK